MLSLKENYCPICNALIDAATGATPDAITPKPGDLSVCLYCTSYLQYDKDLVPQELSVDALLDLPDEVKLTLHRIRKNIKKYQVKILKLIRD